MADCQGRQGTNPAQGFGVAGITTFVIADYGMNAMQFAMFAQQTLVIQVPGPNIPDPHKKYRLLADTVGDGFGNVGKSKLETAVQKPSRQDILSRGKKLGAFAEL